jgi:ATP-dependent Clp protease ATP-binding subunit ClpC
MFRDFSDRARNVMGRAGEEARKLNHEYIGTEHILLGLMAEESGAAARVLHTLGVTFDAVRAGVDSFVQRGTDIVASRTLPFTPRSKQVVEFARDEARSVNQKLIDTEHLLLALLREHEGVACHVLLGLGVRPDELRAEALRIRIALMKIVERSVRPVRASIVHKRKMREELFAHLSAIFEEELARSSDPDAALAQAVRRFGEPHELARELDRSLPIHERLSALVERWVQYRAPESAARYSLRLSVQLFVLMAVVLSLVTTGMYFGYGWIPAVQTLARVFAAMVLLTPLLQFVVCLAFIKMRDAMWGAFGSPKSPARVFLQYLVIAIVSELYLMGVAALAQLDLTVALEAARVGGAIGVITAIAFVALAYTTGPATIRDTQWALLDIAD